MNVDTIDNTSGSIATVPTKLITVKVTEECIKNGVACSCNSCPIALAVDSLLDWGYYSKVGAAKCTIVDGFRNKYFAAVELPYAAIEFISAFDHKQQVKPFEFQINLPMGALKNE